jgi:hypothetical protein
MSCITFKTTIPYLLDVLVIKSRGTEMPLHVIHNIDNTAVNVLLHKTVLGYLPQIHRYDVVDVVEGVALNLTLLVLRRTMGMNLLGLVTGLWMGVGARGVLLRAGPPDMAELAAVPASNKGVGLHGH